MKNPIWLLSGFLGDKNHWGDFAEVLALHTGVSVEVFPWAQEVQGAQTLEQAAYYMAQAAYAEGIRPVLVGYSMGGRLALQCAISAPGAFSAVAALSAHPGFADANAKNSRQQEDLVWAKLLAENFVLFWEKWNERGSLKGSTIPTAPELSAQEKHNWVEYLKFLGTGTQDYLPPLLTDSRLPPVCVVMGENDLNFTQHLKSFPAVVEQYLLPSAGHRLPLDAPDALAKVLAPFIRRSQEII